MFPAFKEWHVITEALGCGKQALILRKGGISEGRGGFAVGHNRFWLFPTAFHAQQDKTRPEASIWYPKPGDLSENEKTLRYFAELTEHRFLNDWAAVAALAPYHFWTEDTVRERFDWARPAGIHLLIVRVFRLDQPIRFAPSAEMGGCKSWIEVPFEFQTHAFQPVLKEMEFTARYREIESVLR